LQKLLYLNPAAPMRPLCDTLACRDIESDWLKLAETGVADADETGGAWIRDGLGYYAHVSPRLRAALQANGIRSSRDIGRVVYAMIDAGLCTPDENDSEEDFAGIFEADELDAYLDRSGLRHARDWPAATKRAVVLGCCIGGAIVCVAASQRAEWRQGIWLGSALLSAGWLLQRWLRTKPQRFGLPWSTLERRRAP